MKLAAAVAGAFGLSSCALEEQPETPGAGGAVAGFGGSAGATKGGSAGAPAAGSAGQQTAGASGSGGSGLGGRGGAGASAGGAAGSLAGSSGAGSGGASAGSTSAGGTNGGGTSAGSSGNAGTSNAGTGNAGSGNAGAGGTAAGSGGQSGSGGSGGKAPVEASMGCGKANPQLGSSQSPLTVSGHQYYVKLPTGYDANKPYPVMIMFNPTGNPISWAEQNAGFERNGAKDVWIRVYPHPANSSSGWGSGDVSFFQPLYDAITGNFCIDKARVFAAGESSGGDFSSILGCEHADKVRAVGPCATKPVNGYPLDASRRNCTGQVTAVVIHGKNDNVVGPENGPATRDFYVDLNHCDSMSVPVAGYTDTLSNCIEYQGCDEGFPVIWCQHTDPEYSNTNHGWPRFAGNFLFELFSTY